MWGCDVGTAGLLDCCLCGCNRSWHLLNGVEEDLQVECVSDSNRVLRGVYDVTNNEICYKVKTMDVLQK